MIVDTSSSSSSSSSSSLACFLFLFLSGGIFSNRASERRSQQQLLHHKQGQLGSIPSHPKRSHPGRQCTTRRETLLMDLGPPRWHFLRRAWFCIIEVVDQLRGGSPTRIFFWFLAFLLSFFHILTLFLSSSAFSACAPRESKQGHKLLVVVEGEGEAEAVRNWQLRMPCFADLFCCWGLHFEAGNLDNKGLFANKVVCLSFKFHHLSCMSRRLVTLPLGYGGGSVGKRIHST